MSDNVKDNIKHLELIQNIINRMSQTSFLIKGWTITLVVALLALFANNTDWRYGLLGLIPIISFWGLDAYYLRQERLFRSLYDRVRLGDSQSGIPPFSMDTSVVKTNVSSWGKVLLSKALVGLYGVLGITIITAIILLQNVG